MSDGELSRLEVLRDMDQRRLTTEAAAQLLGLERRQVFGLLKTYRSEGATGLISKRRGRPSNRRKPEELRDKALAIIRERYWDFGPTLAAEKLREGHGLALGRETLRRWMIAAGIWADRKQRRKHVHQPRHRRECVGELVQVDGCEHWWFEDRGPQCTLLVFIDDATSRLMHLQFVASRRVRFRADPRLRLHRTLRRHHVERRVIRRGEDSGIPDLWSDGFPIEAQSGFHEVRLRAVRVATKGSLERQPEPCIWRSSAARAKRR